MRLTRWLILPLLLVSGCHWKGDGSDEFIRDPLQRASPAAQTGTGRPRDFGVPEQQVPRRDGRADKQMAASRHVEEKWEDKDASRMAPAGRHP